MREVVATVNLARLPRGYTALVDETDPRVRRMLRAGLIVPTGQGEAKPAKPKRKPAA